MQNNKINKQFKNFGKLSRIGTGIAFSVLLMSLIRQLSYAEPVPEQPKVANPHHSTVYEKPTLNLNFQPDPESVKSATGKKLYEKFACAQCHQIEHTGGYVGPTLDGVGRFHSRAYIAAHITDAQARDVESDKFFELVPTSMPTFKATPEQIQGITDYLMTLPKPPDLLNPGRVQQIAPDNVIYR